MRCALARCFRIHEHDVRFLLARRNGFAFVEYLEHVEAGRALTGSDARARAVQRERTVHVVPQGGAHARAFPARPFGGFVRRHRRRLAHGRFLVVIPCARRVRSARRGDCDGCCGCGCGGERRWARSRRCGRWRRFLRDGGWGGRGFFRDGSGSGGGSAGDGRGRGRRLGRYRRQLARHRGGGSHEEHGLRIILTCPLRWRRRPHRHASRWWRRQSALSSGRGLRVGTRVGLELWQVRHGTSENRRSQRVAVQARALGRATEPVSRLRDVALGGEDGGGFERCRDVFGIARLRRRRLHGDPPRLRDRVPYDSVDS